MSTLDQKPWPPNLFDVSMGWNTLDLNRAIQEDLFTRSADEDSVFADSIYEDSNSWSSSRTLWENELQKHELPACVPFINDLKLRYFNDDEDIYNKPLMNPRTMQLVPHPFKGYCDYEEPCEEPKPYSPFTHDHDYSKDITTESKENCRLNIIKSESEPVVEVWKIDSFSEDPQTADLDHPDAWNSYRTETTGRRSSTRAAELKRKMQARKLTSALNAGLKNCKPKRTRQYKSIKPKNSVETTPSQSDIEEWSSYPVRPTCSKITKKKTSKGRVDHSESERHRREVLRANFAALCELIPNRYLRGEKVSSQISKQKILNGAKAYIDVLRLCKGSYKINFLQNQHLKEKWQKRNSLLKLLKYGKKK